MILATVLLSLLISLPQAHGRAPSAPKLNYMSRLKKSCESGLGQSCYDYAMYLRDVVRDKDAKKIQKYVHRACLLTYQPACGRPDKSQKVRATASTDPKNACPPEALNAATFSPTMVPGGSFGVQVTRLDRGSTFERVGLRLGDVITSVNGKPLQSQDQMIGALNEGDVMAEVRRGPSSTRIAVSCR